MRKQLLATAVVTLTCVLISAGGAQAGPYAASASVDNTITLSGVWSHVSHYESDGSWSGLGNPYSDQWKDRAEGPDPIDISTSAGNVYGAVSSSVKVEAPGMSPRIEIHSAGSVYDVSAASSEWAMGYSMGGANWLQSGATQTVTVHVDYTYDLDLSQAHPGTPYAWVKIYVAFWDADHNLMIPPDDEWVSGGAWPREYLIKTVWIWVPGMATGTVTGSMEWDVSVNSGSWYSFWGQADAMTETLMGPVSTEPSTWGRVKSLYR